MSAEPISDSETRRKAWVREFADLLKSVGVRSAGAKGCAGDISHGRWTEDAVAAGQRLLAGLSATGEWT